MGLPTEKNMSSAHTLKSWSNAIAILLIFLSMCCFIPHIFHWGFKDAELTSDSAITKSMVNTANFALMSIAGYMIFEATFDSYMLPSSTKESLPRWMMILAVFVSCALFAAEHNDNPERKLVLMVCCRYFRGCFLGIPLLVIIFDNNKSARAHKSRHIVMIALTLWVAACYILYPFDKLGALQSLTPYLVIIAILLGLYVCGNGVYTGFGDLTAPNTSGFEKYRSLFYFIMAMYFVCSVVIAIAFGNKAWPDCVEAELTAYFVLDMAILSAAFTIPTRMAQHDANTTKVCFTYAVIIVDITCFLSSRTLYKIRRISCGTSVTSCALL
jgi:hypothetical protein